MNNVSLTKEEALDAIIWGGKRRLTNVFGEVKDKLMGRLIGGNAWANDIESAAAEIAFAKFIGEEWVGAVNTFHKPDVGKNWQVRYTSNENGCLIIRKGLDEKKLHQRFALVTGVIPHFTIIGYMTGLDASKPKYLKQYGTRPPAYFVPQSDLIKFEQQVPKHIQPVKIENTFVTNLEEALNNIWESMQIEQEPSEKIQKTSFSYSTSEL
jgi:hypothetical protein